MQDIDFLHFGRYVVVTMTHVNMKELIVSNTSNILALTCVPKLASPIAVMSDNWVMWWDLMYFQGVSLFLANRFVNCGCNSEKIPPWAIESGCLERYESENSLILNLGLHDVMRSMLSPILSDYDRINSVYQTHRSDQQMVEYHRMLIVRGCLH